jgi:hypothetical protein
MEGIEGTRTEQRGGEGGSGKKDPGPRPQLLEHLLLLVEQQCRADRRIRFLDSSAAP